MRLAIALALLGIAAQSQGEILECYFADGTKKLWRAVDPKATGCKPVAEGGPVIVTARRFLPNSDREEKQVGSGQWVRTDISESGEQEGVRYRIDYQTGRATFGDWIASCQVDAIHRFRECYLRQETVTIRIRSTGMFMLYVGDEHYPRSKIYLRLETGKTHSTVEPAWSGAQARAIVRDLTKVSAETRYWEWPYRSDIDRVVRPVGLKLALEYVDFAFQGDSPRKK